MSNYSSPGQAFKLLGDCLQAVHNAEYRYDGAEKQLEAARTEVETARENFNRIRDEVIAEYPEILDGYAGKETVKVVDGQVQVVKT